MSDTWFAWLTILGRLAKWFLLWVAAWFVVGVIIGIAAYAEPLAARQYRNELTREARAVWGLTAPVATMAGQIEQESGWRPDVCSPYACGLTQFTPATATWISGLYSNLAMTDVFNPSWAIRALVRYDHLLHRGFENTATERDRWAFTLSSYNGGAGNLRREIRLCSARVICNPTKWANVSAINSRALWAFRENRGYVNTILDRRQFTYSHWGPTV